MHRSPINQLTVLYDDQCALCCRAKTWLGKQPQYIPLAFVPAVSPRATQLFPTLDTARCRVSLTVVSNRLEVYRDAKAWVACLWALREYRSTALRLKTPGTWWAAQSLIATLSKHRNRFFRKPTR